MGLDRPPHRRLDRRRRPHHRRLRCRPATQAHPLIDVRVFARRAFAVDNTVLLLISAAFIPFFFFGSMYAPGFARRLGHAGRTLLLAFFAGFVVAAQFGGRIFDAHGAKPTIVLGCALSAVGFYLWGSHVTTLEFSAQWHYLVLAGAGHGPRARSGQRRRTQQRSAAPDTAPSPASPRPYATSARASAWPCSAPCLSSQNTARVSDSLVANGVPSTQAHDIAHAVSAGNASGHGGSAASPHAVRLDFAHSTQTDRLGDGRDHARRARRRRRRPAARTRREHRLRDARATGWSA